MPQPCGPPGGACSVRTTLTEPYSVSLGESGTGVPVRPFFPMILTLRPFLSAPIGPQRQDHRGRALQAALVAALADQAGVLLVAEAGLGQGAQGRRSAE